MRYLCAIALLAHSLPGAEAVQGNLASAGWLQNHVKDANLLILDTSPAQAYAAKHIPGAVSADLFLYGLAEMLSARMEKTYQSWGIDPEKTVLLYDQGGGMMATRIFFSLYRDGFPVKNLLILDGGLSKWQESALPVTNERTPAPKHGLFRIARVGEDAQAELPEVLTASGDPASNALVEGLGADWHYGAIRAFHRSGHIPHSVLLPSADFYNPDKTFKSAAEIEKMLSYTGVRREQRIYTYCGGGIAASVPYFALKFILNYPKVKLFTGSELDWLADERELPYWTYDAPFLIRDAGWLQFWGGQMLRSVGLTRVSVVDVRTADAFKQGHVPFSLNIPAEVFRSRIANPDALAEVLGPAGVDPSHEAVVVSGAGLSKDAALAFAMLEKVGQKRVSVLIEPLEKWGKLAAAEPAPAIAPVTYRGAAPRNTVIADPASTRGVYPKVFLDSGKDAAAKAPEGKVVHLPYTDLLNAAGAPKAASDIWNILTKAGVPRYAELVCFSDDPGEAAVNYFVLRLMGYPDVKVLAM